MTEHTEESAGHAIIRLASAQEQMVTEMAKMAKHQAEMNGHVRGHTTQLALESQWAEHHMSKNGIHAMQQKQIDALGAETVELKKLVKVAIAIPTIIVVGGAVAGILALVL